MYDHNPTQDVLDEVQLERESQDAKWGVQDHDHGLWSLILGEEFGEVCKAANELHWSGAPFDDLRMELIQVAAVAVSWVERIDRAAKA